MGSNTIKIPVKTINDSIGSHLKSFGLLDSIDPIIMTAKNQPIRTNRFSSQFNSPGAKDFLYFSCDLVQASPDS